MPKLTDEHIDVKKLRQQAISLADEWLAQSKKYISNKDLAEAKKMNKLFERSEDKSTLISIIDIAFRVHGSYDVAKNIADIFKKDGIPKFFSLFEKFGAVLLMYTYPLFHAILVPIIKHYLFKQSSNYVLFGDDNVLTQRIRENAGKNIQTNVNRVGELLLGEEDAQKRIARYIKDLEIPEIKCISIKISTIYSQISSLSFEESVQKLVEKISIIYRAAKVNTYVDKNGVTKHKLVNFDMEEYRDLPITVEVFKRALDLEEFHDLQAGIALQAYLPDSFKVLQDLTAWAQKKVERGGAPARVRVVKGANIEMESFESGERNWGFTPFQEKHLTDANYKRMLTFALQPENIKAINIGIASHNLFDIAYVYSVAKQNGVLNLCTFEMLSGMSPSVSYFLANELGLTVLLYLPFSTKEDFVSSIGYLMRRLDENTGKDNYLRYIHNLNPQNWEVLKQKFMKSLEVHDLKETPNRLQNRLETPDLVTNSFVNEADTDFSLKNNLKWAAEIKAKFEFANGFKVPSVIGEESVFIEQRSVKMYNHNDKTIEMGAFYSATEADALKALEIAKNDVSFWVRTNFNERKRILQKAVFNIRQKRGEILGFMALNTGKTFLEGDAEVSEAIDFGNFYLQSYERLTNEISGKVEATPKGTSLVLTPWNFPFAIPAGGIFASLTAGNNVIFKPSNFSILVGYELAKCFWEAGVPKSALQFIASDVSSTGVTLTKSQDVNFIVFTGSTQTALNILKNRPSVKIAAETGGKNFTIATKNADRDAVIKNVLHSAFSNSGQKCSATSVLALESELYNDKAFLNNLKDATLSLKTGFAFDFTTKVGPLIRKPLPSLKQALTSLEEGEEWLVEPKCLNIDETLWSPGIKLGVKRGSRSHMEEFFGPVLAIIEIKNLEEGIELANETGYGLTSGLETLNHDERLLWVKKMEAGNLYINRSTTGAMVQRQPFGGFKNSAFGRGIKAGGENYITQFVNFTPVKNGKTQELSSQEFHFVNTLGLPEAEQKTALQNEAFKSYVKNYFNYFSKDIDYQNITGQQNITRFLPAEMVIRVLNNANLQHDINLFFAAKLTLKACKIIFESEDKLQEFKLSNLFNELTKSFEIKVMSDDEFIKVAHTFTRIKFSNHPKISAEVLENAAKTGVAILDENLTGEGRLDLTFFLKEQSISYNYHRYGYIDNSKKI